MYTAHCGWLPVLASMWLKGVSPGSALKVGHQAEFGQGDDDGDAAYEQLATAWDLLEPCPVSVDADSLAAYNRSLRKWQGKKIVIAGDSLTDQVYEPLVCSALLLGARNTVLPGMIWPPRPSQAAAHNSQKSRERGQRTSKHDAVGSTSVRVRRRNVLVFEDGFFDAPGASTLSIEQTRFFDFPVFGPGGVVVASNSTFRTGFYNDVFIEADVLFMNVAHEAYFHVDQLENVIKEVVREATARGFLGRLVLFGHPPQHFDTETGEYAPAAWKAGGCRCRDQQVMRRQIVWKTNAVASKVAQELGVPFIDPWSHYVDGCAHHKNEHDCTHYDTELSLPAKFEAQLLDAGIQALSSHSSAV